MQDYQLFRITNKKNTPHLKLYFTIKCKQEDLKDEPLYVNNQDQDKTNVLIVKTYKSYNLVCETYICNIPHPYILSTTKYPVYYVAYNYSITLITKPLLDFIVTIIILKLLLLI